MSESWSYACRDYPGMEECPGRFTAKTRDEVWKLVELHSVIAHGEDPSSWDAEARKTLQELIRAE